MAELTEVVADVAEEVASNAQTVADVSRGLSGRDVRLVLGGLIIGGVTAWFITNRVTKAKYQAKYEKIAEEEIDAMREHFRSRLVSKEEKPDLGELADKAEDLGYATPVPPKPHTEADPTAVEPDEITRRVFPGPTEIVDTWSYEAEKANRNDPKIPYVIHADEREESGFDSVTFTYYDADDVVCDDQDNVISARDSIIGDHNLDKFGHGSGDPNVVYIRNVALGMEIEIFRSPNSYAEEVHGIKHSDWGYQVHRRKRQRSSPDDD